MINIRNSLKSLIYSKSLKVSMMRNPESSIGTLINHLTSDTEKICYLFYRINGIVFVVIALFLGYFIMYLFVGMAIIAGMTMQGLFIIWYHKFYKT